MIFFFLKVTLSCFHSVLRYWVCDSFVSQSVQFSTGVKTNKSKNKTNKKTTTKTKCSVRNSAKREENRALDIGTKSHSRLAFLKEFQLFHSSQNGFCSRTGKVQIEKQGITDTERLLYDE